MDFSTIATYLYNHLDFVISTCISVVFLVVNIIQAVRTHSLSKLKEALASVPQVIRDIEKLYPPLSYYEDHPYEPILDPIDGSKSLKKKAAAEALLLTRYGKLYEKHSDQFDKAIEDVLNTPQKKGGSVDV